MEKVSHAIFAQEYSRRTIIDLVRQFEPNKVGFPSKERSSFVGIKVDAEINEVLVAKSTERGYIPLEKLFSALEINMMQLTYDPRFLILEVPNVKGEQISVAVSEKDPSAVLYTVKLGNGNKLRILGSDVEPTKIIYEGIIPDALASKIEFVHPDRSQINEWEVETEL